MAELMFSSKPAGSLDIEDWVTIGRAVGDAIEAVLNPEEYAGFNDEEEEDGTEGGYEGKGKDRVKQG